MDTVGVRLEEHRLGVARGHRGRELRHRVEMRREVVQHGYHVRRQVRVRRECVRHRLDLKRNITQLAAVIRKCKAHLLFIWNLSSQQQPKET